MNLEFDEVVDTVGRSIEGLGVAVVVIGVIASVVRYLLELRTDEHRPSAYQRARRSIGRSILLGLELLVAGDIIRTVVVDPTFTSVGVLAAIVAIRTFLSFTLEVEITSKWPWQKDDEQPSRRAPDALGPSDGRGDACDTDVTSGTPPSA